MKKELKSFVVGVGMSAILLGSICLAGTYTDTVQRIYRDIKIKLNGVEIIPKDVTGRVVEPFIINGTTYLPVRAVGEALGLEVGWDGEKNEVSLDGGQSIKIKGLYEGFAETENEVFINDDVVSILAGIENSNDYIDYRVCNVNVFTGEKVSNLELIQSKGFSSEEEFIVALKKSVEKAVESWYGSLKATAMGSVDERQSYMFILNRALANCTAETLLFKDDENVINAIVHIPAMAGADSYQRIIKVER